MDTLRWGIVGCGDVVAKKSGPSILAAKRSRVHAVMRRDAAQLDSIAKQLGAELATTDAAEVIECPEVDIVYIATPPSAHREFVEAAARAGKHVLVEKPMGMSAEDSEAMVEACQKAGVELFVAYYRRFHPQVLKMRELIADGAIGKLVHGQVEYAMPYKAGGGYGWRTQPEVAGGGLFADVVSHRIDLLASFFGEPVHATGAQSMIHADSRTPDLVTATVTFTGGAQCALIGNFATRKFTDRFVLTGTEGEIRTDHLDGGAFTLQQGDEGDRLAYERGAPPHTGLIRHIEDVLAGCAINAVSGREGVYTDRVLDWATRS